MTPIVTTRPLDSERDVRLVRDLLVATHPLVPAGWNWEVRRWDGTVFHNADPRWEAHVRGKVQLWEAAGALVGAVTTEGGGDAHLQLHPGFRHLEEEMVAWAEAHLARQVADGRLLSIFVFDDDADRQAVLSSRGYERGAAGGVTRRQRMAEGSLPPRPVLPAPYVLRTVRADDLEDCGRVADLLNAAFGRTFHSAVEFQNFTRMAPCYRADLDLVAAAPDGTLAAYVGIAWDDLNRHATFEPVCAHPDHRRHGLARALMEEGLHRLASLGAVDVTVETGDQLAANELYDSLGFEEVRRGQWWQRTF